MTWSRERGATGDAGVEHPAGGDDGDGRAGLLPAGRAPGRPRGRSRGGHARSAQLLQGMGKGKCLLHFLFKAYNLLSHASVARALERPLVGYY